MKISHRFSGHDILGKLYLIAHPFKADYQNMNLDQAKEANSQFHLRTGMILCLDRLTAMGLTPRLPVGSFFEKDTESLLKFCEENPQFHIVTRMSAALRINRYVPGGRRYYLAEGDNDPSLRLEFPPETMKECLAETAMIVGRLMTE